MKVLKQTYRGGGWRKLTAQVGQMSNFRRYTEASSALFNYNLTNLNLCSQSLPPPTLITHYTAT